MGEETFITRAEVVQAFFAVRRPQETVLRAPAIAHRQDIAGPAEVGQFVQLGLSEGPLRWALEQFNERSFADIPEAVFEVDKVIAGKKVPVMFDDRNISAGRPKDT